MKDNPVLQYDRSITLSVGGSRQSVNWQRWDTTVSALYGRMMDPVVSPETQAEYFKLPKNEQDALKDTGGFVSGPLNGPRRKADGVLWWDLCVLDVDKIPPYRRDIVKTALDDIGCGYFYGGTRKDRDTAPRLRVIIPLSESVKDIDAHEAIMRKLASFIGIDMVDPTCFQPHQLMYWPSVSSDVEYVWHMEDRPLLKPDAVLASYTDWRDMEQWPYGMAEAGDTRYRKLAVKQGDPYEKKGIVGAFNRAYGDIRNAMNDLLPGVYAPVGDSDDRFTYLNGSTSGGAIIYDDGKFLYSHHATDPCSGRLVNAFDLVRLHKFGDQDGDLPSNTPANRYPSYKAMQELAQSLPNVRAQLVRERREQVEKDFEGIGGTDIQPDAQNASEGLQDVSEGSSESDDVSWEAKLEPTDKGGIKPTIDNILIILENDKQVTGKFALNDFSGKIEVSKTLPWEKEPDDSENGQPHRRAWSDTDSAGLYWFMEHGYRITNRANIDAATEIYSAKHAFHEIRKYLNHLRWDGKLRLDTLFCDFLGADDNDYTRAVARKGFCAAVARVMTPGCKYDQMPILCGPQGLGKSTLLRKMGLKWFNDSLRTFEGKEALDMLQGSWIFEIGELDAFRRGDIEHIKNFLSIQSDQYRQAYAHYKREFPRQCVFFGTTNGKEFLTDSTGNRRFWPVDVGRHDHRNVFTELTPEYIDQVWAEAMFYWSMGEALYLTGSIAELALIAQDEHREVSVKEGPIRDFIDREIPLDWTAWDLSKRRDFWSGNFKSDSIQTVKRDKICALEIWCELFSGSQKDMRNADAREINACLENIEGWTRARSPIRTGLYGHQRGFVRER